MSLNSMKCLWFCEMSVTSLNPCLYGFVTRNICESVKVSLFQEHFWYVHERSISVKAPSYVCLNPWKLRIIFVRDIRESVCPIIVALKTITDIYYVSVRCRACSASPHRERKQVLSIALTEGWYQWICLSDELSKPTQNSVSVQHQHTGRESMKLYQ